MNFSYIMRCAYPTEVYGVQNPEHNRALGEVVCLLRRDLEIESLDVVHEWLYNHSKLKPKRKKGETGKTKKPKPAPDTSAYPTVQSFAFDLFTLLFALRQYFQFLDQNPTKLRIGELSKRLYGYSLHLLKKFSEEELRSLAERLGVGRSEIPADGHLRAFYAWLGALGDVQWWERCM